MSGVSGILVVGAASAGKRLLINGLTFFEQREAGKEVEADAMPDAVDGAPEGAEAFDWTISTRYYTARTRVLLVAGDSSRPGGASDAVLRDYKCDAVILVLDCNRLETFAVLSEWEEALDRAAPSTVLVIGSHADSRGGGGEEKEGGADADWEGVKGRVNDWCLDRGYEFVECNCRDPMASASEREKIGVARVREALQNTMWGSMEYATPLRPSGEALADARAAAAAEPAAAPTGAVGGAGSASSSSSKRDEEGEEERSSKVSEGGAGVGSDSRAEAILHDLLTAGASRPGAAGGAAVAADGADERDGEGGEDEIDHLFAQIAGVRARGKEMSDSQRREAAADLALRLMTTLGLDEGETPGDDA